MSLLSRGLRRALLTIWFVAVLTGCGPRAPREAPRSVSPFGATTPSPRATSLLGREAPNTTLLAMDAGLAGDRISGLLEIPETSCAIVIGRGGESIDDLDLFAYGEDGSVVDADAAPDKTPGLVICPPHPPRVWVAARIAAGHGLVAIGAQRVSAAEAERVAALYGVKSASGSSGHGSVWPGLEGRIEEHRAELGGQWQDVRQVVVPLDARIPTRVSAQIDANRCLDALVLPSAEVGHLELTAMDAEGAIIGRAQASGRERYVVACSPSDARIALEIRPQSGRGLGVLMLSRTRPGSERELDTAVTRLEAFPREDLEAEVREWQAALARAGYGEGRRLASGVVEVGRRNGIALPLAAGCSRIDVVGGSPLRGVEAWVWASGGALVSHGRSSGRATLFACGSATTARLDLEATLRAGPYAVFVRGEPDTHGALAAEPLAAGRLLSNMVERGVLRRASEVGQVSALDLSPSALSSLELTVPFGRCMDVTLALGETALGAEIRLVSVESGQQIAFARGPHSASARACSLDAVSARDRLKTRAELRSAVGSGKGLVATRLLSPAR